MNDPNLRSLVSLVSTNSHGLLDSVFLKQERLTDDWFLFFEINQFQLPGEEVLHVPRTQGGNIPRAHPGTGCNTALRFLSSWVVLQVAIAIWVECPELALRVLLALRLALLCVSGRRSRPSKVTTFIVIDARFEANLRIEGVEIKFQDVNRYLGWNEQNVLTYSAHFEHGYFTRTSNIDWLTYIHLLIRPGQRGGPDTCSIVGGDAVLGW